MTDTVAIIALLVTNLVTGLGLALTYLKQRRDQQQAGPLIAAQAGSEDADAMLKQSQAWKELVEQQRQSYLELSNRFNVLASDCEKSKREMSQQIAALQQRLDERDRARRNRQH